MLEPEHIKKINEVMTACNGDRVKAAQILCMTRTELTSLIRQCVALKQAWAKPQAEKRVTAVQTYNGPSIQVLTPESAEEQERRLDEEFETLMCGKAGLTDEMAAARSLQKAYAQHNSRCMDLVGGNLIERALKLKRLIDKLDEQLLVPEMLDEVTVQKYTTDRTFYIQAHEVLIRIMDQSTRSSLARAKIKQMEGTKETGKPKGKPGFSPKTTVMVQEKMA